MHSSILYQISPRLIALLLFAGIITFYFIGLGISKYKTKRYPGFEPSGMGPFEGAMLGLLWLLLAFTFNKSASYYDSRRELIIHETNSIGTALLRCDMYPDSLRQAFRSDFKEYIDERIRYYEAGTNEKRIHASLQKANIISERIWNRAATIAQDEGVATKSMQTIPALNDMIDVVTTREEARNILVPSSILGLLFILCLAGSFIVGYASKHQKADWIVLICYSMMTVMTIYIILDLAQPRYGMINNDLTHDYMYELFNNFQ